MTMQVLGMGNATDVVSEQDFWTTTKLADPGLGVWLRAEPPRTGNAEFDKLITGGRYKIQGFPLKTVTVSTTTDKKKGKRPPPAATMEVTQLDAGATVPATAFEIPAGYKETEMLPTGKKGVKDSEAGEIHDEEALDPPRASPPSSPWPRASRPRRRATARA